MKRYIALILSVCLICTLMAACGNSSDSVSSGASSVDTLLDPNADSFNSIGADMPASSDTSVSSEESSQPATSSQATSRTVSAAYKDYSYAMNAAKAMGVYDFSGATKYTVKKDGGVKLYEVILSAKSTGTCYVSEQTEISKDYQNQSLGKTEQLKYGSSDDKAYSLYRATYDLDPDNNEERTNTATFSAPKLNGFVNTATVFSIKESDIASYTERTSDDKTYFKFVIKNTNGGMLLQNNFQAIDASDINNLTVSYFVVTLTTDGTGAAIEYSVTVNCNIDDSNGKFDYTLSSGWKVASTDATAITVNKPDWVK